MELKISSPCPVSWDSLVGDDRVRYCGKCRLNVYNLADLPPDQVDRLVRENEGRLCGRLYVREDQTATVRDCPQSVFRRRVRAALAVALPVVLGAAAWCCWSPPPATAPTPPWIQAMLDWIHPRPPAKLGEIACPPPKPTVPPPKPE
jgi:hypothetical protein